MSRVFNNFSSLSRSHVLFLCVVGKKSTAPQPGAETLFVTACFLCRHTPPHSSTLQKGSALKKLEILKQVSDYKVSTPLEGFCYQMGLNIRGVSALVHEVFAIELYKLGIRSVQMCPVDCKVKFLSISIIIPLIF